MYNLNEKIIQYLKKYKENGVAVPVSLEEKPKEKENTVETDESRETLKNDLKRLGNELKGRDEKTTLTELEYTPLTQEEIETEAKKNVDQKYQLKINELDEKLKKSTADTESASEALKESSKQKKQEVERSYDALEKKVSENAINRGIARSSIVAEQIKDLGVEKIRDLLSVDDNLAGELKKNADKISTLQSDYKTAVSNLNIEKALEISENIDKLTKEQNEKIEEVLKYNNTVKRQQASIDQGVKEPSDLESARIRSEIVSKTIDYYSKLPKNERLSAFDGDSEIIELLGSMASVVRNYVKTLE
ncbi:MAG: hypothetical protein IJA97_01430 [Clostridia bacterium]|nr:hypothetical protein [Clostridia bacterium]